MAKTYIRGTPKIGRNEPCFCGSGRKFKQCHGRIKHTLPALLARDKFEKEITDKIRQELERHNAQELQRQKQQGFGRQIISTEYNGYRFVLVGDQMIYGKWKSFSDFLMSYIKRTMGERWGNQEIARPLVERHPILMWYDKICRLRVAHAKESGELFSTPITGAISAYNRLAYNLYLIAHNGKDIQTKLIERLKNKDNFQGAFFETQVAAWLINAGFELEFEDESDRSSKHCEFTATHKSTGEMYSVEAKSRQIDSTNLSRAKVGSSLYKALEKNANHKRLIFLDLNKPLHSEEAATIAVERAEKIILQSENLTIGELPAPEAYVCITNMNDQYVLDSSALTTMVSFRGFKIHDFMGDEFKSLREAARAREKHWPIFQLFKSMEDHREIPQTFGGELPSEVFVRNPRPRLQIGQSYIVPGPDRCDIKADLVDVTVADNLAYCVYRDPTTKEHWISTLELTSEEQTDYEKHPDTFFGVYKRQSRPVKNAIDLFDFFVEGYREIPKKKLIELLPNYSNQEELSIMSQEELVEILAERYTYGAIANGFKVKQKPKRHQSTIP